MDRARAFGIAILGAGLVFGGGSASARAGSAATTLAPAPAALAPCTGTHPDDRSHEGDDEDRAGEGRGNGDRGLHLGWERGRGQAQRDAHGRWHGERGRSGEAGARHEDRDGEHEDEHEDQNDDENDDENGRRSDCGNPQTTPSPVAGFPGGIPSSTGPVAAGYIRYSGTVVDSVTNLPVAGVCVYAGPANGCPSPSLVTDAHGHWDFDFPSGTDWAFNFEHPAYRPAQQLTGNPVDVRLVPR